MKKPFFDRRVEKCSLIGAKTRLFSEVYRKMAKSDSQFIFFSFLKVVGMVLISFGTIGLLGKVYTKNPPPLN